MIDETALKFWNVHDLIPFWQADQPAETGHLGLVRFVRSWRLYLAISAHIFGKTALELSELADILESDDRPGTEPRSLIRQIEGISFPGEITAYLRQAAEMLMEPQNISSPSIADVPLSYQELRRVFPDVEGLSYSFYEVFMGDVEVNEDEHLDELISYYEPCNDYVALLVGQIHRLRVMYPDPAELQRVLDNDFQLVRGEQRWAEWLAHVEDYCTAHIRDHDHQRKAEQAKGKEQP